MDKKGTLIIFLASAIVGALLALIYFFLLSDKPKSDDTVIKPAGIEKPEDSKKSIPKDTRTRNPELKIDDTLIKPQSKYDLSRINENPEAIARAIAKLAENPDMDLLKAMVSERLIPAEVAAVIEKALKLT